jgi:hypothetical protein
LVVKVGGGIGPVAEGMVMAYQRYQVAIAEVGVCHGVFFPPVFIKVIAYTAVNDVEFTQNGIKEGRFTGAAGAGDGPLFVLLYLPVEGVEECFVEIPDGDMFQGQERVLCFFHDFLIGLRGFCIVYKNNRNIESFQYFYDKPAYDELENQSI